MLAAAAAAAFLLLVGTLLPFSLLPSSLPAVCSHPTSPPPLAPTPSYTPGDEIAQTHYGNNNWYGHDDRIGHVHWDALEADPARGALLRFASELIKFRRACPLLRRDTFLG